MILWDVEGGSRVRTFSGTRRLERLLCVEFKVRHSALAPWRILELALLLGRHNHFWMY